MGTFPKEISNTMVTSFDAGAAADPSLSIAAVANLIGVTTHTLRKWESRHGIAIPERTDTGRRHYGAKQVRELQLVKKLLDLGHALPHLAGLSEEALQLSLAEHDNAGPEHLLRSVDLVGPNIARQLEGWGDVEARIASLDEDVWLHAGPMNADAQALVFEASTLPSDTIDKLISLRQNHYEQIIVIARMTSRRTRRQLRQHGITAIDTVIPVPMLLTLLNQPIEPAAVPPPAAQKFTAQQLAGVVAMIPSVDCECPNHIAQLLIDITAFEQYSKECTNTDPAEAKLHALLGDISGQARSLFESALVAVAEADNLDLNNIASDSRAPRPLPAS